MRRDLTRRLFLNGLLGGLGLATLTSCSMMPRGLRLSKPVLKFPENANEIADFWEFFAEPSFTAEAAVKGLNITGERDEMKQGEDRLWTTYPKQNDLVGRLRIDSYKDEIEEMFIYYEKPISIDLGRLEFLFGTPRNFGGPVGALSLLNAVPAPVAANRTPGQGPRGAYYMQFSFDTTHSTADGKVIKGRVGVSADGDYKLDVGSKTRNVDYLEFSKSQYL